jgi:taurine dioxygenase
VSEGFSGRVVGLGGEESEELLERLHQHATHLRHVYAHRWRPGDLVFWVSRFAWLR